MIRGFETRSAFADWNAHCESLGTQKSACAPKHYRSRLSVKNECLSCANMRSDRKVLHPTSCSRLNVRLYLVDLIRSFCLVAPWFVQIHSWTVLMHEKTFRASACGHPVRKMLSPFPKVPDSKWGCWLEESVFQQLFLKTQKPFTGIRL